MKVNLNGKRVEFNIDDFLGKLLKVKTKTDTYVGVVDVVTRKEGYMWAIWVSLSSYKSEAQAINFVIKWHNTERVKPKSVETFLDAIKYLEQIVYYYRGYPYPHTFLSAGKWQIYMLARL